MKIKHNKTKNTGLIYELLVKQIASDTLAGKDSQAINILKKYYTGSSFLVKEFKLYDFVLRNKNISQSKAETLINTVTEISRKLDQNSLKKQKYNLIKEIRDHYNIDEFFSIKVPNYKTLAGLYCLIEAQNNIEQVDLQVLIDNKVTVLEHLTLTPPDTSEANDSLLQEFSKYDKDLRLLAYRLLLEKYNKKYDNLLPQQKEVIREFITSVSSTNKLRQNVNNRLEELKIDIQRFVPKVKDPIAVIKINEVVRGISLVDNKSKVTEETLTLLMQYYELLQELKKL